MMKPGEIICQREYVELNTGLECVLITAVNTGSRPIQIGSHFHFFEANRFLSFDRKAAFGFRPDIPSGAAIRFEAGEKKEVRLVRIGGKRVVMGLNNLTDGPISESTRASSMNKVACKGFAAEGKKQ